MCALAFVKLALLGPPVPHKLLCSCYSVAVGASPLGGTCGDPYRARSVCILFFREVWRPAALQSCVACKDAGQCVLPVLLN